MTRGLAPELRHFVTLAEAGVVPSPHELADAKQALEYQTACAHENTEYADALRRTGVENPCKKCRGWGRHYYSHGSTWRGGVGTVGGRWDICDSCWGSGDAKLPFEDRRALEAEWSDQVNKATLQNWIGRGVMAHICATHADAKWILREVIGFLGSLERRRKNPVPARAVGILEELRGSLRRLLGDEPEDDDDA